MPEATNDVDIDSLAKVLGVSSKQARNLMEKQPEKLLAVNDGWVSLYEVSVLV